MQYDVIIIGGGIHGLMTAYYLSQEPNIKVAILEQYSIGNVLGSSHGASRIIRATYVQKVYRNLMSQVYQQYLPKLEKDLGVQLLYHNPGIFFGDGKLFQDYVDGIADSNLPIKLLSTEQAMSLFPQFKLQKATSVVYDQTGGVMAADVCINTLKRKLIQNGVTILEGTKVTEINRDKELIEIVTQTRRFFAHKVVVTAGKQVSELISTMKNVLDVIEQVVMYVKFKDSLEQYMLSRFPQFASIHDQVNEIYYGMSELFSNGIVKISQHVSQTDFDDTMESQEDVIALRIEKLTNFIDTTFVASIDKVIGVEKCFYTNTPDENFIVDLLPDDSRIVVGSICSGHGFKFAPLTGKILAELALHEKTTNTEFEKNRVMFSISRYLNR